MTTVATHTVTDDSDAAEAALFGTGPYHNIRRGIELRAIGDDFSGLFVTELMPRGTVLWQNRANGPAERAYRKIYAEDIPHLTEEEMKYFIRYSYQNDVDYFISPLNEAEVNLDYSNYWNHSCAPNTLPQGEDTWVAIRDIHPGEQLTIDYACFDSNPWICIDRCLCGCGPEVCRDFVRGDDYRITELQTRYAGHFLPYIQKKIDEERAIIAAGGYIEGGAGGRQNAYDMASVRAYHHRTPVDIPSHNARGMAALLARFAPTSRRPTLEAASSTSASSESDSSPDASPRHSSPAKAPLISVA